MPPLGATPIHPQRIWVAAVARFGRSPLCRFFCCRTGSFVDSPQIRLGTMDCSSRARHLLSDLCAAYPYSLRHFVYRRVPCHTNSDIRFLLLVHTLSGHSFGVSCAFRPYVAQPWEQTVAQSASAAAANTRHFSPAWISSLRSLAGPARRRHCFRPHRFRFLRSIWDRNSDSHRPHSGTFTRLSDTTERDGGSGGRARTERRTVPQHFGKVLDDRTTQQYRSAHSRAICPQRARYACDSHRTRKTAGPCSLAKG